MLEYSVGSSMERDDLHAELSFNSVQWGEISLSDDRKSVTIIIYPNNNDVIKFNYDDFLHLVEKAKNHLLKLEPLAE